MSRTASGASPAITDWSSFLPVREFFALDYRSLALFRVCLAVMLLLDWADRLPDLYSLYSDEGAVPRQAFSTLQPVSVHILSGSVWWQAALAVLAMGFALMMLVGWQTPLATFFSFLLLISIHGRNPAVMHGADHLLRGLLFWSIFLPLGAKWSVDSSGEGRQPEGKTVLSFATFALMGQLFVMYLFAAAWKWSPEWRDKSTAVLLALQVDALATRVGKWLRSYQVVCEWLTRGSLWLETLGPAVLLLPFNVGLQRLVVIFLFIGFHAGLGLTMELSLFPWVACSAWLALLPASFWDRLERHWRTPELDGTVVVYDPARPRATWATRLLNSWLLFGAGKVLPAGEGVASKVHGPLLPRVQSQGGWAVISPDGTERTGADALLQLFRLSPVFSPLAWVLQKVPAASEWVAGLVGGPATGKAPPAGEPAWKPPMSTVATAVLVLCFVYVVLYNLRNIGTEYGQEDPTFMPRPESEKTAFNRFIENMMPPQFLQFGVVSGLEQGWGVFAPRPARSAGWYYAIATLQDGTQREMIRGTSPPDTSKPENYQTTFSNGRWRRFFLNLGSKVPYAYVLPGYSEYVIREWNKEHPDNKVARLYVFYFNWPNNNPGMEQEGQEVLLDHYVYDPEGKAEYERLLNRKAAAHKKVAEARMEQELKTAQAAVLEANKELLDYIRERAKGKLESK